MEYLVRNKIDYFSKIVRILNSRNIEKHAEELRNNIHCDLSVVYNNQLTHLKYNDNVMLEALTELINTPHLLMTKSEQVGVHPEDGIPVMHEFSIVNPALFDTTYDVLVKHSESIQFGAAFPTPSRFKLSLDFVK